MTAEVKRLIQIGADVNYRDRRRGREGWTPLIAAASGGNAKTVAALLDAGANPELSDAEGWRPIHFAVGYPLGAIEKRTDVLRVLIDAGADLNSVTAKGPPGINGTAGCDTALFIAALFGRPDSVRLLLGAGADVSLRKFAGISPAYAAAATARGADVLAIFVKAGVDLSEDMEIAKRKNQTEIYERLVAAWDRGSTKRRTSITTLFTILALVLRELGPLRRRLRA